MLFPLPATMTEMVRDDKDDCVSVAEVPLGAALNKRFYLPLVLHSSLVRVLRKGQAGALRMPELETALADADITYKTFVNKLAHICDSAKGGHKVTAFAVLQLGTVRYYFTSNNRDEEDYQRTAHYITGVIDVLGRARDDELQIHNGSPIEERPVFLRLLRTIIGFNQSRIKGYICHMRRNLDFCVKIVRNDKSEEGEFPQTTKLLFSLTQIQSRPSYIAQLGAFATFAAIPSRYRQHG